MIQTESIGKRTMSEINAMTCCMIKVRILPIQNVDQDNDNSYGYE
jgi:hypothetical protein